MNRKDQTEGRGSSRRGCERLFQGLDRELETVIKEVGAGI
jgi:hypothetical protein